MRRRRRRVVDAFVMRDDFRLQKLWDIDEERGDQDRDGVCHHPLGHGVGVDQVSVHYRKADCDVPEIKN